MQPNWLNTVSAAAPSDSERPLLVGRYEVGPELGAGGFGAVFAARDRHIGRDVAIKVLHRGDGVERFRRETAALRLLQLPGVVQLLDEFEHDGDTCLVMDLIEGTPFPGPQAKRWDAISGPVLSLLETLGRVHGLGVVHRDLKPANVLVDAAGRAVLLDFGLSAGAALGPALTQAGTALGTPAYFSPEQCHGQPADARSDLFAVGLMIYESLAGALPHADGGPQALWLRATRPARSLAEAAPDVPAHVAAAVDALLEVRPGDRPQTAGEALRDLAGPGSSVGAGLDTAWPWLGPREVVEGAAQQLLSGRSASVGGPPGAGRTRTCLEVLALVEAAGRPVHRLGSNPRPLGSLLDVLGEPEADSWIGARDQAAAQLSALQASGAVLFVDTDRPVDRWTAELLDRAWENGGILRVCAEGAERDVQGLSEAALRPLFGGLEPIFHLPSDAAAELWRRTDGLPGRMRRELQSWCRAGLASPVGQRYEIDRDALVRLQSGLSLVARGEARSLHSVPRNLSDLLAWIEIAWPHSTEAVLQAATGDAPWRLEAELFELTRQGLARRRADGVYESLLGGRPLAAWSASERREAHGVLAALLDSTEPARLFHLAASEAREALAEATVDFAAQMLAEGRLPEGEAAVQEALRAIRGDGSPWEVPLLREGAQLALAQGSPGAYQRALLSLDRAMEPDGAACETLRGLLGAAQALADRLHARALDLLDGIGADDDPRMERWRRALRAQAAALLDPARRAAEFAELRAWADRAGDQETLASVASWEAMICFREGRFDEAARLHEQAAAATGRRTFGLSAQLNAASAHMEGGQYERAGALAEQARGQAEAIRHAAYEARAIWIERAAAYRGGQALDLDPDLAAAFEALGQPNLRALFAVAEVGIAWRSGSPELVSLATRARDLWSALGVAEAAGLMDAVLLARSAGGESGPSAPADAALASATPEVSAQTAALLRIGGVPVLPAQLEGAREAAARACARNPEVNAGVLTWAEIAEALGVC